MVGAALPAVADGFRCLAIETSSSVSGIAVCGGGRIITAEYGSPGEQSRQVYACVRDVLRDAGLALAELDCIAFGCGPGGFTGLRVGAAVAQGLAFGAGLRVCRVSSLAALAAAAVARHGVATVAACVDARMGEAYFGQYRAVDGRLVNLVADRLIDPSAWCLREDGVLAAGAGWAVHPALVDANASRLIGVDVDLAPTAEALLALAAADFADGRTVRPCDAVPNYVRDKVTS